MLGRTLSAMSKYRSFQEGCLSPPPYCFKGHFEQKQTNECIYLESEPEGLEDPLVWGSLMLGPQNLTLFPKSWKLCLVQGLLQCLGPRGLREACGWIGQVTGAGGEDEDLISFIFVIENNFSWCIITHIHPGMNLNVAICGKRRNNCGKSGMCPCSADANETAGFGKEVPSFSR